MSGKHHLGMEPEEPVTKAVSAPKFVEHEKKIHTTQDLHNWVRSRAYYDVVAYISNTSVAIQGQKMRGTYPITEQMRKLCNMFNRLEHLVNENLPPGWQLKNLRSHKPPAQSTRQSCLRSYRAWMRHMHHNVFFMLDRAINPKCQFLHELGYYFSQSFGSPTCLDFGPGNELMFIFFLCGLFRASVLAAEDTIAAALMLYERYTQLVRRLLVVYMLPTSAARKHYNLVDYYALAHVWGAAQLAIDEPFDPLSCESPQTVDVYRDDYMIISAIDFLQKHRGRLREHAYQLWCILSAPNWSDVYDGLSRSYVKEILGSFSMVTNCVFSDLMSFDFVPTGTKIVSAILGKPEPHQRTTATATRLSKSYDGEEESLLEEHEETEMKPPVERYVAPERETLFTYDKPTKHIDYSNDFHPHPYCMARGDLQAVMHSQMEMQNRGPMANTIVDVGDIVGAAFGINKEIVASGLHFGDRMSIANKSSTETSSSNDGSQ